MAERQRGDIGNYGFKQAAEAALGNVSADAAALNPREEFLRFVPLSWLPERKQRLEKSRPYLDVAGHEAGHLLTAMALGYSGDVSFNPDGESIARVSLHGDVHVEDMKTIAAAGMVDTPFGRAFGFGSDKFKIRVMNFLHGGRNVDQAQAAAESALHSYGPVWERFSEILAYFAADGSPVISADTVWKIYQRALGELAFEKIVPIGQAENPPIAKKRNEERIRTIISEQPGYVTVTKINKDEGNKVVEAYRICSKCRGIEGHNPDCPVPKEEEGGKKATRSQRIFDWKDRARHFTDPAIGLLGQTISRLISVPPTAGD